MNHYHFETDCVHGAYRATGGEPQNVPIAQSTTYRYSTCDEVAALFDLTSATHMYTRISNPTVEQLEKKIALLHGGTAAAATSSGQSATMCALLNICESGDHILSSANIYGGSHNLIGVTFAKFGIEHTFVDPDLPEDELFAAVRPNTKVLFAETLANPALTVLDFEKWSRVAKRAGVPLIIDNTLASAALCRPLEHGADIVVESTTKYCDGNASSVGGIVVDGGRFDWKASGRYPGLTEPDESYHGLVFADAFPTCPFAVKVRAQLLRDLGCVMSPMNAYLTLSGLQTLHLRMKQHSANAMAMAKYLRSNPNVAWVEYAGLPDSPYASLAQKYLPDGQSGVLCFGVKGGMEAGKKFIENLKLISLVVHVGDIRTCVLHPASTTHRQLTEDEQRAAGVLPEQIRMSVGIEDVGDLIADVEQALTAACG